MDKSNLRCLHCIHCVAGVTAENQEQADARIPILRATPAAVRFVSIEPMIGAVDLSGHMRESNCWYCPACDREVAGSAVTYEETHDVRCEGGCGGTVTAFPNLIDWVIVGGESGPKARPMYLTWARSVRDQCVENGVPFFFKQWGTYPMISKVNEYDILDGQQWRQFPGVCPSK